MMMRMWLVALVLLALAAVLFFGLERARTAPPEETVQVVPVPGGGTVPDAAVDAEGIIHLVYLAGDNVYYVRSDNDGQTFSRPVRVNTEAGFASGGRYRGPDLALGSDGTIHVVWYNAGYQQQRPTDEWGVMYGRLRQGESAFEASRNLNHRPSDNYSLAVDENGRVAVVWMAEALYVSLSDDGGTSFDRPMQLDADPCECCGSRALYAQNGNLFVLYRDKADDERDMYLALLPAGERTFMHEKLSRTAWHIEACPMTGGFLSRDGAGLVAGWETREQVFFTRLDEGGRPLAPGEIQAADRGRYPVVLRAPDGTTLVAWKNGSQLEWQGYDAGSNRQGPRGTMPGVSQDRPAGVVTERGRFLLFP